MGWGHFGVCEACWEEVEPFRGVEATPPELGRDASPFLALAAYGAYSGRLRDLIHALKFEGLRRLAVPLGRLAAQGVMANGTGGEAADSVVVPVLTDQLVAGYRQRQLPFRARVLLPARVRLRRQSIGRLTQC